MSKIKGLFFDLAFTFIAASIAIPLADTLPRRAWPVRNFPLWMSAILLVAGIIHALCSYLAKPVRNVLKKAFKGSVSRESGCFALLSYFATIVGVALLGLFKLFNSQYAESYNYLVWTLVGISVFFLATGYSRDETTETESLPLSAVDTRIIARIIPCEERTDDGQSLATDESDEEHW